MASLASQLFLHLVLLLLFATIFSYIIPFFPLHLHIVAKLFAKLFSIFRIFLVHVCKFLLFGFYFANFLMQVFMCLQFPIAFYIKQCKVFIFILTIFSYLFFLTFYNVCQCEKVL
jgi:hypothetical protein